MKKRSTTINTKRKHLLWLLLIPILFAAAGIDYIVFQRVSKISDQNSTSTTVIDEPLTPKKNNSPINATTISTDNPIKHDVTIPPIQNGFAPVISNLNTKEPVVFLGIDDGANKQSFELQLMKNNNIKASLFLANRFISDNPSFFKDFMSEGSQIEDHTMDHKLLPALTYNQQKQEICDEADLFTKEYGRRPILFRPPGGSYNQDTQKAAADCGMKAVVIWVAKANGGSMQYQVGHSLRPGDIVLMHFRPEFQKDMQAFISAEKAAGLHTELLEDWL